MKQMRTETGVQKKQPPVWAARQENYMKEAKLQLSRIKIEERSGCRLQQQQGQGFKAKNSKVLLLRESTQRLSRTGRKTAGQTGQ